MQNSHVNLNWSSELKMSNPTFLFPYKKGIQYIVDNEKREHDQNFHCCGNI